MPNVHLTPQMQDFAEREIATGAYADLSEVVRAGMRRLMEERGAAAFYALKCDFEEQVRQTRAGKGGRCEAVRSARLRAPRLRVTADGPAVLVTEAAEADLTDIWTYTEEVWGEAQWLSYYREMLRTFERIAAYPLSGRSRERFAPGLRSVPFREHVIFYLPMEGGGAAPPAHPARCAER